jgi:RPA family protein
LPLLRQPARKVRILDLMGGTWVKKEGMEPSFVTTPYGEDVARARILGTVVAKFVSEDGNFGSLTLDDGSDTMRAKCFKELDPLEKAEIGDLVDVIGKVREYNEEVYLMPETILKVEPNWELLRRLELIRKLRGFKKPAQPAGPAKEAPQQAPGEKAQEPDGGKDSGALRKKILKMIESRDEGMEFREIMEKAGAPEPQVEAVLNDILSEGICYEPTPGKIRKI